jgi:cyclic beta-1,2-glucan synthetase
MTLTLRGRTITLRHGTPPAASAPPRDPTHHAAVGEWIDWRTLPDGALLQIDSAEASPQAAEKLLA